MFAYMTHKVGIHAHVSHFEFDDEIEILDLAT